MNGWTTENSELRKTIICSLNYDIYGICETHLKGTDRIDIPNYNFFGFNRTLLHRRAPHAFGGVGFLIKNSVTRDYNLEIFDKIYDGIFGIRLTNKCTDMSIIIFVSYLPPDNSPYGKDVDGFFLHLTAQLHLASDADLIFICGDMNARVGEQNDLLTDQIEDICILKIFFIDFPTNKHGSSMIDFCKTVGFCILNGRYPHDNYTCIKQGRSVVVYIMIPYDKYHCIDRFAVETTTDLVSRYNLQHLLRTNSKMPDHSILYVKVDLSMYNMLILNDINDNLQVENKYRHTSKALQDPPADFMKNDNWRNIDLLIKELETRVQVQQDLDSIYEKLTCAIHNEIDLSLNIKACTKKHKTT